MKITIITTLEISEQNEWLIPIIVWKYWYVKEENIEESIKTICNDYFKWNMRRLIEPQIPSYFGEMNRHISDAVIEQLWGAITVDTSIT